MTEEQAKYMGETPSDQMYRIRDEAPHDYFTQIPNIVDILGLSPYAYRLYGHLRKVAGESGKCWQSTRTLAKACNMSEGKVSQCKTELENVYPPLIRIESKSFDKGIYHEITITDIWTLNHAFFTGEEVAIKCADGTVIHHMNGSDSPHEQDRSPHEQDRSPHETKKNPIKKNPIKKKRGNLVDAYRDLSQMPGTKREIRLEGIQSRIAVCLNITPSWKRWERFIRHADKQEQELGQTVERFFDWLKAKPKFDVNFWPPDKMQEVWPQAFMKQEEYDSFVTL